MADETLAVVIADDPDDVRVDHETGTIEVPQGDGVVVVHLDAARQQADDNDEDPFYANLALAIPEGVLGRLAEDLHQAIDADDQSRQGNLVNYERALDLLGTELKEPKASVEDSGAAADGLSVVTNPLLLENCLKGWANAVGELLPAEGPAKIQDDGDPNAERDELADAYERDMNHYLTVTASEYYPDTSSMLLWGTHLRGSGFKKVYRCPLRRRPVSESVDAKDLIVSNTKKDLRSCERVTHQIEMRPSVMQRMIMAKAYRKVDLGQPSGNTSGVDEKIAGVQGTTAKPSRPEDQPYMVWESQCEFDLAGYGWEDKKAPQAFRDDSVPVPYIVTLDKDSHKVLAVRRDWSEDDEDCQRKRLYLRYPYVPGPGFYGTGLLNILGNCSAAMTAAWRMALDTGMFANFPGGLVSKDASRQNSSVIKLAPGEFPQIETGGKDIRATVMGLPFKDVTSGLLSLMDKIQAQANAAGAAAEVPVGEGLANVPVGTMLAAVEQATKVMGAAFKGMHVAQSEEIAMFVDLFRERPEDFWRNCKTAKPDYWTEQKFGQAIGDYNLVPRSDPNVPSHIHRIAKAWALSQLYAVPALAGAMDPREGLRRILRAIKEDPNGLILPPPPAPTGPDPQTLLASAKVTTAQAQATAAGAKAQTAQAEAAQAPQQAAIEQQKDQTQRDIAAADLQKEQIIHAGDMAKVAHDARMDQATHGLEVAKTAHDAAHDDRQHALDVAAHQLDVHHALNPPEPQTPKKGQ